MADGDWGKFVGYRTDIDLNDRWWHRLAKVAYSLLAALVLIFVGFLTFADGDSNLKAKYPNVTVTSTLGEVLQETTDSANVIPAFLALPGRLGKKNDETKIMAYVSTYNLERSVCAANPAGHLAEITAVLNRRSYSSNNTEEAVLSSIRAQFASPDGTVSRSLRLCWLDGDLANADFNSIVKYEYGVRGYLVSWFDLLWPIVLGLTVAHAVFQLAYYRGLVYIVVGSRKETLVRSPARTVEADDYEESVEDS